MQIQLPVYALSLSRMLDQINMVCRFRSTAKLMCKKKLQYSPPVHHSLRSRTSHSNSNTTFIGCKNIHLKFHTMQSRKTLAKGVDFMSVRMCPLTGSLSFFHSPGITYNFQPSWSKLLEYRW